MQIRPADIAERILGVYQFKAERTDVDVQRPQKVAAEVQPTRLEDGNLTLEGAMSGGGNSPADQAYRIDAQGSMGRGNYYAQKVRAQLEKLDFLRDLQFAQELNSPEMAAIASAMKDWRFSVSGDSGWTGAQVCAGGVATESVNPETMESRIVKGLYFAGEILDIDGDSGGYNLQWAWSSGYTAGISAALAR